MSQVNVKSLGRNSAFAAIMQLWQIGSRFVLTPLIIHRIGLAGYGTWTLLFGICAYVSMFDTSFGFAYAKFTAEYDKKKDYLTLSRIIGSGLALVTGFGTVTLMAIWTFRDPILRTLKVPPELQIDAGWALLIVGICFLLRMSFGSVHQVLAGLQRIDLQYKLAVLSSALEFVVALILLARGWGLIGLAFGHLLGQVIGMLAGRGLCWKLCPALHISPFHFSWSALRLVVSLGGRFQLLSLANTMIEQIVKMLMSGMCGVSFLALFELADKLIGLGKTASGSLIAPLMPAFAHLHSGDDRHRWYTLYLLVTKLVAITATVSLGFLFLMADRLIVLWTGQNFPQAAWTIRAMVLTQYLTLMTGVGTASLRGKGTLNLEIRYMAVSLVFLLGLGIPLLFIRPEYSSMVMVLTISQGLGALWFLRAFSRLEDLNFRSFFIDVVLKALVLGAAVTALGFTVRPSLEDNFPEWGPRWVAVAETVVLAPLYCLVLTPVLWFGIMTRPQRQSVLGSFGVKEKSVESPSVTAVR